jgi:YVTN family beta-propeller protein
MITALLAAPLLLAEQQVLLVLLKGASALGIYSMEGQAIAKIPVGLHPHEMVLSRDGRFAYITDNGVMRIENEGKGGNTVSVVDLHQRKRVDTIGGFGRLRRPHGIAIDPPTGRLAVTVEFPVSGMFLLDGNKRSKMRVLETDGVTSHMVTFGPGKSGAEHAYVSNSGSNDVSVVQLTTGGELKKIPAGKRPEGSVLSPNGKELYVCNRDSDTITIIDTERRAAQGEFKTGQGPVRIGATPDGRQLIYACMRGRYIEFADLETRRPVARLPVDGEPISMSVTRDGKLALAAVEEKDTVYVVSVPDRKLVRKFQVEKGAAPDPVLLATIP